MQKTRLAISIIALMAVVVFGLTTSTFRVAKADATPECNCSSSSYDGRACSSSGVDNGYGPYCCAYTCYIITECQ